MAAAVIVLAGCKNAGTKKAQQVAEEPDAEQLAAAAAEEMNKLIEEIEADEEISARETLEKISTAQTNSLLESVEETLKKNPDAVLPFAVVENKPGFNGGEANEFSKWVNEQIKYPQEAIDQNLSGKVLLQFTVTKEGDVKDVKVLRGVNEILDNEAIRVVESSPKWEAGTLKGTPVAVNYVFPVSFKLN